MKGCYIITDMQNRCMAYSEEAQGLFQQLKPGLSIDKILELDDSENHEDRVIVMDNLSYRVASFPLLPENRLYHFTLAASKRTANTVTLCCAEINHKIRNPLTSMKLVADMLPVYLPEGSFKEKALEVLHNQIGKLETYTSELVARAGEPDE